MFYRTLSHRRNHRRCTAGRVGHSVLVERLERRLLLTIAESGDFLAEVQRLRDVSFGRDSGRYDEPTLQEQTDFAALARSIMDGDLVTADTRAAALGYEVVEFTDTVSSDLYIGAREQLTGGEQTHGWGSYFVNPSFRSDSLVEVVHPRNDTNSWHAGAVAFRDSQARGFLMAGAHRHANGDGTADVAHLLQSVFQSVHEEWIGPGPNATTTTWQPHGFNDANHSFPAGTDAVLSNGDAQVVSTEVVDLDARFEAAGFMTFAFNQLDVNDPLNVTVNGAQDGDTFSSLGARTNVQGIYSRSKNATFVHVEMEQSIRFSPTNLTTASTLLAEAILPAGFTVTESHDDTVVTEKGSTDAFTVVLDSKPATDVVLSISDGGSDEISLDRSSLTFTSANWDQAQTVTITGTDDALQDGDQLSTITVAVNTNLSDQKFDSLSAKTIEVTTLDDEGKFLDVDGNTAADAATDGILMIRYLFGFRGAPLINGAVAGNATLTTAAEVEAALDDSLATLDADGNGVRDAATDGILIIRYLFGFRDAPLVAGAIGSGATRTTGPQVAAFLDGFLPPPPAARRLDVAGVVNNGINEIATLAMDKSRRALSTTVYATSEDTNPIAKAANGGDIYPMAFAASLLDENETDLFDVADSETEIVRWIEDETDSSSLDQQYFAIVDWLSVI